MSEIPFEDIAYYRRRNRNRAYTEVVRIFAECAQKRGMSKADLARRLGCDPAQINRWLKRPGNSTLDTISDLLLACGYEMGYDPLRIGGRISNYTHPFVGEMEADGHALVLMQRGSSIQETQPSTESFSRRIREESLDVRTG